MSRNWTRDGKELEDVFRGIKQRMWPVWLISFSEGTRFTQSKYASSINWCKEHNHPIMKHILYPRVHGFIATVSALRHTKHVRAVCDMTIAYARGNNFMQAPSSWQTIPTADLAKEAYKFYIHNDRYDTNELPESGLSKWLKRDGSRKGRDWKC